MLGLGKPTENPTETEPHKGIRFFGARIEPKRRRFGCSAITAETMDLLTTSEIQR